MDKSRELIELIADVKEQVLYLQELGVETLDAKVESGKWKLESAAPSISTAAPLSEINFKVEMPTPAESRPAVSRLSALPSLSKRPDSASVALKQVKRPEAPIIPAMPEPIETIDQVRAEIGPNCTRCKLSRLGRSQVVNSTGNFNADLMFVGEAPGADEDEQGFPFVGRAGKLLTDIIMAIGFKREDVFIGNINRCRPPGNRAPEPDETVACKPFLKREIAVVRPKVIVVLGATAAQNLLETKVPIGKLRGQFHDYLGVKVMPTFHPAYLLRDPHKKREVWEDMKMVRDYLQANS